MYPRQWTISKTKGSFLSLSPFVIDQSVFAGKATQTPEIYYYTGYGKAKRQYNYSQYKNELEDRVVQVDSRAGGIRDANAILKKFGVSPILIPDFLALVGDSADGYPGISGIGKTGAARLLNQYGPIEDFPEKVLGRQREQALLFKRLATLRTDALLFSDVDQLRWRGPTSAFAELTTKMGEQGLLARANAVASKVT